MLKANEHHTQLSHERWATAVQLFRLTEDLPLAQSLVLLEMSAKKANANSLAHS